MNRRIHVYYSGLVHGVGFRYTSERIAVSLGLKGWTKNLRDGRVEVVCEGKESALKEFLDKTEKSFKEYVKGVDLEWSEATGEFRDFDIRFD